MSKDKLDLLANEIEQAFMQRGGWDTCRHLLGKLSESCHQESQRFKARHDEIIGELYGQGYEVRGFHMNGNLISLDSFFEDSDDWLEDEPIAREDNTKGKR